MATADSATTPPIVCGMARFHGEDVMLVGHQKARDTKQKVYRNFGMPNPEGYRKALRVMKIAEKVRQAHDSLSWILAGAYPGLGPKNEGKREAIARNLREMARLQVPTSPPLSEKAAVAALWPLLLPIVFS